ncbi:MAG: SagB/ThcOx family dehydrogenase [Elusimicrobiota bacterium]|nr:SagB/ThcOx family dehydrogenase [Elusimicrobiota bacterium]
MAEYKYNPNPAYGVISSSLNSNLKFKTFFVKLIEDMLPVFFVFVIAAINIGFGEDKIIKLPAPEYRGKVSVEEAIFRRRSIRRYKNDPLTLQEVSQLLWSAGGKTIDGITGATRSYPSAGGIYPLEIYLVSGNVKGLSAGIYRYNWKQHSLSLIKSGDVRNQLMLATYGQQMVSQAPVSLVFTAIYERTTRHYGERGRVRYVSMDLGHAGQNVHLQAEALGLGTVVIGAFHDETVKSILGIKTKKPTEEPLYIMPVGKY